MTLSEFTGQVFTGLLFAQKADDPQTNIIDQYFFVPFVVLAVLYIFMFVLPEKKRRREQDQSKDGLKKNDRVQTIGGILGIVVNVNKSSDEVTLKIDEGNNTKLRIKRSAIAHIISDDKGDKDNKEED
jgi:preprotein translocase subunit YajC